MPVKRSQNKATPLAVPGPGQDAAERKRVLNVLAQRRYRQKRKEHIRKLEAQVDLVEPAREILQPQVSPPSNEASIESTLRYHDEQAESESYLPRCIFAAAHFPPVEAEEALPIDLTMEAQQLTSPFVSMLPDDYDLWDTSILLPSLPSTPLSTSKHSSSGESETWSAPPLSVATQSPEAQPATFQAPLAAADATYSFPDEAYLEMTELTLLRGCMDIARRMNIHEIVWSLTAVSPFTSSDMTLAEFDHLPANLRPTLIQMSIPHHPLIDLLPWPSARDRLIKILVQPPEARPPGAASPMALLEFAYDIEDGAEGVRISGNDPYCENNWEVGEKVFKSWWWVFDRNIIRRSNELRASRGAPMLGGSILGELP